MLVSYANNSFPEDYIPTVFENYNATVMWENYTVSLGLWDTAGQDDYDKLRPLSYPETQIFLVCYSVIHPDSYNNVQFKWKPELEHFSPDVPIVLVGTKLDLREDAELVKKLHEKGSQPIMTDDGLKLKEEIKASAFCECSAKTQKGLYETFNECIRVVLKPDVKHVSKKKKCALM
jgi:Ras-related C3 botulinum toxin substrate 1